MSDQPISTLASELLSRELAKNPDQFKVERSVDRSEPGMSPATLAWLGGLADAASTYAFMKRGTTHEQNPLVRGIAGNSPEATGLTAIGGLLTTRALSGLIGKKWPKLAEILSANLGANQLGLAVKNTANTFGLEHNSSDSFKEWHDVLGRNRMVEADKLHQRGYR